MLLFLSADAIMTLTFLVVFAYLRVKAHTWPAAFHFGSALMAAGMTLFLLAGSFTAFLAARAQHGGEAEKEAPARWLAVTIAEWCCFLLLLGLEWGRLIFMVGVTLRSNPWGVPAFGATYYFVTGLAGVHVLAGVIYMTVLAVRKLDVRPAQWYVHFVNVIWLLIFVGIYLAGADLEGL